jgi:hypothetical protein
MEGSDSHDELHENVRIENRKAWLLLIVRDHKSKGPPSIFWKHNDRGKGSVQDKFEWKIQIDEADDAPRRYLKNQIHFLLIMVLMYRHVDIVWPHNSLKVSTLVRCYDNVRKF